jgi:predicted amidophosphoribosyltransferase
MPRVIDLTDPYGNFMLAPRPGPGVCEICFDFTGGISRCRWCPETDPWLDAVAPISYSIAHEQLHHALSGYKRPPDPVAERFQLELAAVLWRYLQIHETCLASAAGTKAFDLVTTVPSSTRARDATHPIHRIAGELVAPTRSRFARILRRSQARTQPREFNPGKFEAITNLDGRSVLLVDDTWTTGANARSAAAALRAAGAVTVAAVVIGRHLRRDWSDNDRRLKALSSPFDWHTCPHRRVLPPPKQECFVSD